MWKRLCGALTITGLGLAGLLMIAVGNAAADEIEFLCAAALQPAMDELVPAFQKASGHTVNIRFANITVNTASVQRRARRSCRRIAGAMGRACEGRKARCRHAGDYCQGRPRRLRQEGRRETGHRLHRVFRNAFSTARAIAIPMALHNPVGTYATRLFDKLGVTAEFDRKNAIRGGGSPLQAVAKGDAELGFTQISEIIAAPEVELVGSFSGRNSELYDFRGGNSSRCKTGHRRQGVPRICPVACSQCGSPFKRSGIARSKVRGRRFPVIARNS